MKKIILIIGLGALVSLIAIYQYSKPKVIKVDLPQAVEHEAFEDIVMEDDALPIVVDKPVVTEKTQPSKSVEEKEKPVEEAKKTSINLAVPFTSQAPTANWEHPFQDACEEASILMVDYYYQGKKFSTAASTEKILMDMIAWQEEHMTGDIDMSIEEVAYFVSHYWDYDYEIIDIPNTADIEKYLNKGQPVVIPVNGKILANPYFSNGGPDYHMLTIKGYVDGNFITNDPGTRRGADFVYTYENIMASIVDWDQKSSTATGMPRALVLIKKT